MLWIFQLIFNTLVLVLMGWFLWGRKRHSIQVNSQGGLHEALSQLSERANEFDSLVASHQEKMNKQFRILAALCARAKAILAKGHPQRDASSMELESLEALEIRSAFEESPSEESLETVSEFEKSAFSSHRPPKDLKAVFYNS